MRSNFAETLCDDTYFKLAKFGEKARKASHIEMDEGNDRPFSKPIE
jgi:hypothetical protein